MENVLRRLNARVLSGNEFKLTRRSTCSCAALLLVLLVPFEANGAPGTLLKAIPNPNLNPAAFDEFGWASASLGNTFVVGCYGDDPGGVLNAGCVYQFDSATGNMIRKITNPEPQLRANFGNSVAAIGGNFAVANFVDSPGAPNSIYTFDGVTGEHLLTIRPPVGEAFGGTYLEPNLAAYDGDVLVQGSLGVMLFDSSTGTLLRSLSVSGSTDPFFGRSMAQRGSEIIVGGASSMFVFDGATGDLRSSMPDPTGAGLAQLAVTSSGDIFALYGNGAAYLFDGVSHASLLSFSIPGPDYTYARTVATMGDRLFVGNESYNDAAGAVFAFDAKTGSHLLTMNNPSHTAREYFGKSLTVVGQNILIGSILADIRTGLRDDAGAVYLFEGFPAGVPEPSALALGAIAALVQFPKRRGTRRELRPAQVTANSTFSR